MSRKYHERARQHADYDHASFLDPISLTRRSPEDRSPEDVVAPVGQGVTTKTTGVVRGRECRIPAVSGTGGGTAVLQDGQLIELDGDAGTVLVVG